MVLTRTESEVEVSDAELLALMGRHSANTILRTVTEPMTAKEISQFADVPLSTVYREVKRLTDANLLDERIDIDSQRGHHVSRYVRTFDTIEIAMTDEGVAVQVFT
jgi:DNA-binding transcriptional ArsR family regulator